VGVKIYPTTTRLATGSRIAAKTILDMLIGLPKVTSSVLPYTPRGSSKEPLLVFAFNQTPKTVSKIDFGFKFKKAVATR
jgi:hypothetical protein